MTRAVVHFSAFREITPQLSILIILIHLIIICQLVRQSFAAFSSIFLTHSDRRRFMQHSRLGCKAASRCIIKLPAVSLPPAEKILFLSCVILILFQGIVSYYLSTPMISTSQSAPAGRSLTATHERAGFPVKYFAYTSLNAWKSAMSARKHVVLITSS